MLEQIRKTAAEILAAAVFELFPNVQLIGGDSTSFGFFYDFEFPHPLHPELHFQIEEKMRQIVREDREIRCLEMVAVSAQEFLKSKGHFLLADQVDGLGLFQIFQMGSFIDLFSGEALSSSKELTSFKLFPAIALDKEKIRMTGMAHSSKDELKEFLKKWQHYPQRRHEKVGCLKGFWIESEGSFIWLKDGIDARERLISQLKESLFQGVFEVSLPQSLDRSQEHQRLMQTMQVLSVGEIFSFIKEEGDSHFVEDLGFLDPTEGTKLQVTTSLQNITSSLQSIRKTLTILGFKCEIFAVFRRKDQASRLIMDAFKELGWPYEALSGDGEEVAHVDFRVVDGLGRAWSAARLCVKRVVVSQLIVERNLALLIEQSLV